MKKTIKKVTDPLKKVIFRVLDVLAQQGSHIAHRLACRLLPY